MNDTSVLSGRSSATSLAIGILLGAVLGVATSFLFLLIIVGPLLGLGLAIAGLRGGPDGRPRATVGGGLLIGMGFVYLLEAINTLISCEGHEDVCGGASALPFLGLAIAVLAVGLLLEGITIARVR